MLFEDPKHKKAVAYYRHSAEDKQENSVPIQREHAEKFAKENGIEIIHEESDEGKSGLTANRPGFISLLNNWIISPSAPHFDYVLVYDVSRWGRFQDQNEPAHYEFICKEYGKKIIYISRGFPKEEQQLIGTLQTSIERYMAAEYSRALSDKVFHGCVKVSEQGYSAGGTACYGMGRLLLDVDKKPIRLLERGEHKMIANQRVTFVPLNDDSTKAVKEMYTLLVKEWRNIADLVEIFNEREIPSANGGRWTREKVLRILTNETYTGTRIYNKTWGRLKQKSRHNPRNEWVITPRAFPAIVDANLFAAAQERLYWLIPSKWKRGIYLTNKVRRQIKDEVIKMFVEQGMDSEEVSLKAEQIPLTFSISFYKDSVPHWCFVISEQMRNFESALGVSLILDQREPIYKFFLLPTKDFTSSNFLTFSEKDMEYQSYFIATKDLREKILAVK